VAFWVARVAFAIEAPGGGEAVALMASRAPASPHVRSWAARLGKTASPVMCVGGEGEGQEGESRWLGRWGCASSSQLQASQSSKRPGT
jgi:hypothetical protein